MTIDKKKSKRKGFTIIELIVLIILIVLFCWGFKFGSRYVAELLINYRDTFWFGWLVLITGIASGIIPVSVFIMVSYCIGMVLEKRKNRNQTIKNS